MRSIILHPCQLAAGRILEMTGDLQEMSFYCAGFGKRPCVDPRSRSRDMVFLYDECLLDDKDAAMEPGHHDERCRALMRLFDGDEGRFS